MKFFKNLLEPVTNGSEMANFIIQLIGAKISETTLKKEIEEHPDYPSLLSISDFFTIHGIENIVLQIYTNQLAETSNPFIIQLNDSEGKLPIFSVVREITNNTVNYFDPEKHDWILIAKEDFAKKITGIVLMVGKGDEICERGYEEKIKAERRSRMLQYVWIFCIPLLPIVLGICYFVKDGGIILFPFLYLLLTIIGCGLGVLLIWYDLDQHNPVINQICTAGKKINCGSILNSDASKIAGLSWSTIGLSYFTGLLLLLIFGRLDNKDVLYMLSWISLLTMPYIMFSIYYQWMVAKQWCVLCLSVMVILALQIIISGFAGWHTIANFNSITAGLFIQILIAFIFSMLIINVLLPALKKVKEGRDYFIKLQNVNNDPTVFNALLKKQKEVNEIPDNLGITLGNPNGKYKIIKVCNPYCGPCAEAHQQLEDIIDSNEDVRLQILFTATNDKNDIKTPPVKHFLALADKYDEKSLKQALDDWYLNETKNYEAFAVKYPVNEELDEQDKKIEMMKNWCDNIKIEYTPTFFISMNSGHDDYSSNYFQIPSTYTVNDLKYILLNK